MEKAFGPWAVAATLRGRRRCRAPEGNLAVRSKGRFFVPSSIPFSHAREAWLFVSRWSIRRKLLVCLAIVLAIVAALAYSGFAGGYSYRELARTIGVRATDLKHSGDLRESLGELRVSLSQTWELGQLNEIYSESATREIWLRGQFGQKLAKVEQDLLEYRKHLDAATLSDPRLGDRLQERRTIAELETVLAHLKQTHSDARVRFDLSLAARVAPEIDQMYVKASALQARMHDLMRDFARNVKTEYRTWIFTEWAATIVAIIFMPVAILLFYDWLFQPLELLLAGSRRIAREDDFNHRIHLKNHDEMAELAAALNDMTARFQEIRNDLDAQVKQRTIEVVRSEQLASVGFLAAGVAHEINNPLASIAWCAESLDSRLHDALSGDDSGPAELPADDVEILRKYLRRIQDEAFRCKGITEKLLDFSRLGDVEVQPTDLGELVQGEIEMVRHLGKYRQKKIEFESTQYVVAPVNAQEIKQVVLNLITNALDSLDPSGVVRISLVKNGPWAELVVRDNGCGMSEEVQRHLFEPFFTRRRDGSGTGLGLSITYRIVTDHGGTIEPASDGPGRGAQMRVLLPLVAKEKAHERESEKRAA
jgi:signal transduction histidine kinase